MRELSAPEDETDPTYLLCQHLAIHTMKMRFTSSWLKQAMTVEFISEYKQSWKSKMHCTIDLTCAC